MSMTDNLTNSAMRRQLINGLARADLNTFAKVVLEILYGNKEWQKADYLDLLSTKVQEAITRRGSRLIINLPPRHLKSHIAVISAVAWVIGRNPSLQLMIACHTDRLVQTHLNAIRRVLRSDRFIEIFGAVIGGKDTQAEVETEQGGRIIAVSFQSAPTGIGCDILFIDDPLQAHDANNPEAQERCFEFYQDSLLSRLNPQGMGAVVLAMQRLSRGDLAGRLLEFGTYEQLSLPMIAIEPEAIDLEGPLGPIRYRREPGQPLNPNMDFEAWKKKHPEISEFTFATQYQQNPQVPGGTIIKEEWLGSISVDGLIQDKQGAVIQSWDTATSQAASASYSTCLTCYASKHRLVVLDCFRIRCEAAQLMDHAEQLAARYRPKRILVEKANIGPAIGGVLQRKGFHVEEIHVGQDKEQRLNNCLAAFQQLMVFLPKDATWLAGYKDELLSFPFSRFNDQVDATSQLINWVWPYVIGRSEDKTLWQEKRLVARALQTDPTYARVGRGLERFDPSDHAPYRPTRGPRWRR